MIVDICDDWTKVKFPITNKVSFLGKHSNQTTTCFVNETMTIGQSTSVHICQSTTRQNLNFVLLIR